MQETIAKAQFSVSSMLKCSRMGENVRHVLGTQNWSKDNEKRTIQYAALPLEPRVKERAQHILMKPPSHCCTRGRKKRWTWCNEIRKSEQDLRWHLGSDLGIHCENLSSQWKLEASEMFSKWGGERVRGWEHLQIQEFWLASLRGNLHLVNLSLTVCHD